jgi:hypothetical protein
MIGTRNAAVVWLVDRYSRTALRRIYTSWTGKYANIAWLYDTMIFVRKLANDGHTRRFSIVLSTEAGWIAREESDRTPLHTSIIHDWARVEATMLLFDRKASDLRSQGWADIPSTI